MIYFSYFLGFITPIICYMVILKKENHVKNRVLKEKIEDINQNFDFIENKQAYIPKKDVKRIATGKEQEYFD